MQLFMRKWKRDGGISLLIVLALWLAGCVPANQTGGPPVERPAQEGNSTVVEVNIRPTQAAESAGAGLEAPTELDPAADLAAAPSGETADELLQPLTEVNETPLTPLEQFIAQLKGAVSGHDYDLLGSLMSDPFATGPWRSQWQTWPAGSGVEPLRQMWLHPDSNVVFSDLNSDDIQALLLGMPPEQMLGPDIRVASVLHSSGWGMVGQDEAILFISDQGNEQYRWQAFLYNQGRFEMPSNLPEIEPPPGLLYYHQGEIWQIDPEGNGQMLYGSGQETAPMPSPDGRYVASRAGLSSIRLDNRQTGQASLLTADWLLSDMLVWGDTQTLLLGVYLDEQEADGPNLGHLARLDVPSGEFQLVDAERLMSSYPALAPDGQTIAFSTIARGQDDQDTAHLVHPTRGIESLAFGSLLGGSPQDRLISPAWSADGRQIAWLYIGDGQTQVVLFDLATQTFRRLGQGDSARFGGPEPAPVWSPDGRWLSQAFWQEGAEGPTLWLLSADGQQQIRVDDTAWSPIWWQSDLLIYWKADSASSYGGQTQVYELSGERRSRLNLPDGSMADSLARTTE